MSLTKRLFAFAGAALSVSVAATAQTSTMDQSRSYASELMSDASTRTSSLAPQAQDFSVNVHGYTQFRYNWNQRDDDFLDEDSTIGFQNARTAVNVSGNIATENWGYFVQWEWSDAEGSGANLTDAFGYYKMGNGWSFKFGQFKLPLYREELVGDTYQLFANRSVVNSASGFNQGRSQGIQFAYEGDVFRFAGAFSDGLNTANTDFNSPAEADWAITARGEWKWAGDWKQSKDFTSFRNSDFFGMVGFAGNYQSGGETFATTDSSGWNLTADVSIEGNGWNAFAAAAWVDTDPAFGDSTDVYSFQIQGGIFVSENWELVAGYDVLIPDNDDFDNYNTVRIGANNYFIPDSHAAKLTIDFSYFIDATTSALAPPNTLTGLLATDSEGEWNLRAQMQLMF
jgi:hypothetical protein